MSKYTNDFFEGKRSWSLIKDKILETYINPYVAKVINRGQTIVLIDGYAGPGTFKDGTEGSPIIMCRAGATFAKGNFRAVFINKSKKYNDQLRMAVNDFGWSNFVQTLCGDTTQLLPGIFEKLRQESVLLYLDPFGPTGCNFNLLKPFLERDPVHSTEIILTLSMPSIPRFATAKAIRRGRQDEPLIQQYNQLLTNVLGDDSWKDFMWREDMDTETKDQRFVSAYCSKLARYMTYTGFCPVRAHEDGRVKYFVVFASRHRDTLVIMNDAMFTIYKEAMDEAEAANGQLRLFDWEAMRSEKEINRVLDVLIQEMVAQYPGRTRKDIWVEILKRKFMVYRQSEYRKRVQYLVEQGVLTCPTPRRTKLLNDDCVLNVAPTKQALF